MELLPAYSTMTLTTEVEPEEEDPWNMPVLQNTGVRWSGKYLLSQNLLDFICIFSSSTIISLILCFKNVKFQEKGTALLYIFA